MKNKLLLGISMLLTIVCVPRSQAQKLDGVYVGAELYTTPFEGMQVDHIAIYFRNNGTFTDKLDNKNWRTHISGTYSINKGLVDITFNKEDKRMKYLIAGNGTLQSTSGIKHSLHKAMKVSTLPAGSYEKRSVSSSAGMGSGMPNVTSESSKYLYFDGKGKFSFNQSSFTGIAGNTVGGTIGGRLGENNQTSIGSYKLGDGEITLTLSDGKVSKHSFFYSPPSEEDLIVLDGAFYFREEQSDPEKNVKETSQAESKTVALNEKKVLPRPFELLSKLRTNYGGTNIDKIRTIRENGTLSGNMRTTTIADLDSRRIRTELWQSGKLLLVKQLEGDNGWQWSRNKKQPLAKSDKDEMELSFYQGILGLHKQMSTNLMEGTVSESKGDYLLTFFVKGKKVIYLVGPDFKLKANAYSIKDKPIFSVYRNFTTVNGISYPKITEASDGKNTITVNTTSMEINPSLKAEDWNAP